MANRSIRTAERDELLQRIIEWLDVPLTILALVLLGLLIAEFALPLTPFWASAVGQAQTAIWAMFTVAFVVQLVIATDKIAYLRQNWLTAISVILPAFRAIRVLRVARALRGLNLVRLLTVLNRGTRAIGDIARQHQFGYVAAITLAVGATAAAGAYFFERDVAGSPIASPGEAIWWAAGILADKEPGFDALSAEGRLIGVLLRVFAQVIIGYVTAAVAVYLFGRETLARDESAADIRRLREDIARLEQLVRQGQHVSGR